MQINKILLTGLLCAFYFASFSQKKDQLLLSGSVQTTDLQPLPNASVQIKALKAGTVTGGNGSYTLRGLKEGSFTLEVSAVGYKTQKTTVVLKANEPAVTLDFMLEDSSEQMNTVNVLGKTEKRQLTESGFNVNAIETKNYANTTADLNQILSRSTGVSVRETGGLGSDFNFSINGLSGKQVKFFIDGIPMESFGSSMSLNNIPVNMAERIEVYKGVVPVELGADALGGAVNIVTNQHVKQFLDASYSYGSFNTHRASLSGRYTDAKTGFTIIANGFYNYSDNNYTMKNIVLPSASEGRNFKRFNDGFHSAMGQIEAGFRDKKWADVLLIGFQYSDRYKEIQTGATQTSVYGKVHTYGDFLMPSLKFKKDNLFIKGLSANIFATYAQEKTTTVDTAAVLYQWDGSYVPDANFGEMAGLSLFKYKNTFAVVRTNLSYALNNTNSFSLNYSINSGRREGLETYGSANQQSNTLDVPNELDKGILGLSWQNNLFSNRLTTSVFGKQYRMHSYIRTAVYYNSGGYVKEEAEKTTNNYGYGIATRFKLTEDLGLKASYEHAFRLPEVEELFGDGSTILANPALKPEESDNVNIGAYFSARHNDHHFSVEAAGFYRNAKDFINATPGGAAFSTYLNIGTTRITGLEGEVKYDYSNLLSLAVNASYMNAINTDEGKSTFENRIPTQPWLYGNANFGIGQNDVFGVKGNRLQFNWFTQYVHFYYLTWPGKGLESTKNRIPMQMIHNATATYSMQEGRYNISLESRNIFDALAFDNFRLQKPGRAFYIKLRYFIK